MTKNKTFPLNDSLACASYAIYLAIYIHAYVKKAENIGKVMTRRVANTWRKQYPQLRIKNKTPFSLYLIVMFEMLFYSLLL